MADDASEIMRRYLECFFMSNLNVAKPDDKNACKRDFFIVI